VRYLLDVNVLVALAWPAHIHHESAHAWFDGRASAAWATCPSTQAGFVRVLSSPSFSPDALSPQQAFVHLERLVAAAGHAFWADDKSLSSSPFVAVERIAGTKQVTDAHLLAVALRHRGALATLDRGCRQIVPKGAPASSVELVPVS